MDWGRWFGALREVFGDRRRRVAVHGGRAHLELRVMDEGQRAALHRRLAERLEPLPGIAWFDLVPWMRRLLVAFDPDLVTADDLVAVVQAAETACGLDALPFAADDAAYPAYPADLAPLAVVGLDLVVDAIGVGTAVAGRLLGGAVQPLQIDVLALFSLAEATPRVRDVLDARLGRQTTHLVLRLGNALTQGLVQSPLGPLVDLLHRALQAGELAAWHETWTGREPVLCTPPPSGHAEPGAPGPRPVPLPAGPVEQFLEVALTGALGAFGLGVAATGSIADASAPLVGGLPKPARLGREAFAGLLGRALARRGVVALDAAVLRRLDRVDCLCVSAGLLDDADAEALLAAARRVGLRVVVAGGDELPATGTALVAGIQDLQRAGHVVLLVAAEGSAALRAADVGLACCVEADTPWGADLLAGSAALDDARLLIDACAAARDVAAQSVAVAELGGSLGFLVAFGGLRWQTTARVMTVLHLATVAAMANGARHALAVTARPRPQRRDRTPWHAVEPEEALRRLGATSAGLSEHEAVRRRIVVPVRSRAAAAVEALAVQLDTPLTPFLAAGSALSAVMGSVVDAALVGGVLIVNAITGAVAQVRADAAVADLDREQHHWARVRRDGVERLVEVDELVVGDVMLLQAGDTVRADCRVLEAAGLEVDESSLTGESLPVAKSAAPCDAEAVADRRSVVWAGTAVAAGRGTAVVFAIGDQTEGRRGLADGPSMAPPSGVEARLDRLTAVTGPLALASGATVLMTALLRGRPMAEALGAGVGLAVAAVPEGLPLLATMAELATARRLSARGALVRNARAIEALGRVDVVCFDKTGTLTEGKIQVRAVHDGRNEWALEALDPAGRDVLVTALRATPRPPADGRLPHLTDRALVDGAAAAGVRRGDWVILDELPFEPERGFHATLARSAGAAVVAVKGAPELVLPRCATGPEGTQLDDARRVVLAEIARGLAHRGLRVLAVAQRVAAGGAALDADAVRDLAFAGFVGLSDRIRPSAVDAIDGLRRAGVRPLMITGDHPSTAEAIAVELGLLDGGAVLTGAELDRLDAEALGARVREATVFARVTPSHKLRIVAALQEAGHVVAMTGDGANDAPAIRHAAVGIALGRRGTSAARSASDLVVTDDRIETVVGALLEGRAMWASVRDAVAVLVGGNLGELAFTVLGALLGNGSPLNARQLLLVNLLTDALPAMAIAQRPPLHATPDALAAEGPEASLGMALDRDMAWRAIFTASAATGAWLLARPLGSPKRAGTVALASLVGAQLGQTLTAGGTSPLVVATSLGSVGALVAAIELPGVSRFFGCTPLGPLGWATASGTALLATAASVVVPRVVGAAGPVPPAVADWFAYLQGLFPDARSASSRELAGRLAKAKSTRMTGASRFTPRPEA